MSKKLRLLSFVMTVLILVVSLPVYAFAEAIENMVSDTIEGEDILLTYSNDVISEREELREENVKHFLLSDGTSRAVVYEGPVHYLDNGAWRDIDNTLSLLGGEYGAKNKYEIKFANKSGPSNLLSIKDGDYKITFTPVNANKSDVEIVNPEKKSSKKFDDLKRPEGLTSKAIYKDIYDGVDLEYVLTGHDIKENIIVKERLGEYSFIFEIKTKNLSVSVENGIIAFTDSDTGEEKYHIPAPYMYDASGEYSLAAEYTVEENGNGKYILTLNADKEWMNADDRAFPVVIDPTVIMTQGWGVGSANGYGAAIDLGYMYFIGTDSGLNDMRTYVKATVPTMPSSAVITNAELILTVMESSGSGGFNVGAFKVNSSWNSSSMNPSVDATPCDILKVNTATDLLKFNITKLAKGWTPGASNNGVCIKAVDHIGQNGYYAVIGSGNDGSASGPRMEISYVDTVGLESYYNYYSSSASGAGSGYVNAFTGSLTFVHDTFSTADEILPYTVSLIYNSEKGAWRNSFDEKIVKQTLPDGNAVYKWTDSDGTEHYLSRIWKVNNNDQVVYYDYGKDGSLTSTATGKYYDTDGLGVSLAVGSTELTLTDDKDNKKVYSKYDGKLLNIEDSNGNARIFTYSGNNLIKISLIPYDNGSPIDQILLEYDGNRLTKIINIQTGVYCDVSYSVNGLVSGIKYVYSDNSENTASFEYDGTKLTLAKDNKTLKGVKYGYNTNSRVINVIETAYDGEAEHSGISSSISYGSGYTDYICDGVKTVYRFDYKGRVITAYSTDTENSVMYGSTSYVYNDMYTDGQSTVKTNNSLKSVTQSGSTAPNKLTNSGFESGLGNWETSGTVSRKTMSEDPEYTGGHRYVMTLSGASSAKQSVYLANGTYTVSMDVLKHYMQGSGYIRIYQGNSLIESITISKNPSANANTAELWEREYLTFDVSTAGTYKVAIEYIASGSMYVDDIMFERSKGMGTYSSFDNGDFENTVNLTGSQNASSVSNAGILGTTAVKLSSAGLSNSKYFKYTHTSNDNWQDENWIISGWAKAPNAVLSSNKDSSASVFGIKLKIYYQYVGTDEMLIPFNPECNDWQYLCQSLTASRTQSGTGYQDDITHIEVYLCYDNNVGEAYFDNISITKATSVVNYEYNGLGNIKKVSSSNGAFTEYKYASDNAVDVTGITDEHGRAYDVDNTADHKVSSVGYKGTGASLKLESDYSYNAQGQVTSSTSKAYDTGRVMLTQTSYVTDASKSCYSKTSTVTDERGNVTRYFYYSNGLLKGIYDSLIIGTRYTL